MRYEKEALHKKLQDKIREEDDRESQHLSKVRNLHNEMEEYRKEISQLKDELK